MAFEKVDYTDEQTMITAKNMNDIQDAILGQEKNANRMDVLAIGTKRQGSSVYDFTYSHTAEEVVNAYNSGKLVSLTVRADGQEYATTVAEENGQVFFSPILERFDQASQGKYVTFSADSELGWGTYPGNGTASDLYLLPQFSRAQTLRYYVPMFNTQSNTLGFDSVNLAIDLGSTLEELFDAAFTATPSEGEASVASRITDSETLSLLEDIIGTCIAAFKNGRSVILKQESNESSFAGGEKLGQISNVFDSPYAQKILTHFASMGVEADEYGGSYYSCNYQLEVEIFYPSAGSPARSACICLTCRKRKGTIV